MAYYPLKATGVKGSQIEFTLNDVPKRYDEDLLFLANRPGTELLHLNSLRRGTNIFTIDGNRVYEGDVIRSLSSKQVYLVIYKAGIRVKSLRGSSIPVEELGVFERAGLITDYLPNFELLDNNIYFQLRYKTKTGIRFKLQNIVSSLDDKLILKIGGSTECIPFTDIMQSCNAKGIFKERLFFEDSVYNGYSVKMIHGSLFLLKGAEKISLSNKEQLDNIRKNLP